MRLKLTFKVNKKQFPKDYRKYFISFIKHSINSSDQEYYKEIYEDESGVVKPFTFAIYFVKPKFEEDQIVIVEDDITMNISFEGYEYGIKFYNGFVQQLRKTYNLGNETSIVLTSIQLGKEKNISGEKMIIKTLSPVIVRNHNTTENDNGADRYLKYSDEEFIKYLKDTIARSLNESDSINIKDIESKVSELKITPLKMKSIPIAHFLDRIGTYLEGNIGELMFEGDPVILKHLYQVGVGSRRAQGFGMVDII